MRPSEFRDLLKENGDADLLDVCLRRDEVPFICADAASWSEFRKAMVQEVAGLAAPDIRIVGSARFGFSMKPRNHLRAFTEDSDIDVVVVSDALFDQLWVALLTAAYPRLAATREIGKWDMPGRQELFAGWLTPTAIHMDWKIIGQRGVPLFQFKQRWFSALKLAARHAARPHHDVQGRLYRTWQHAELYHLHSIAQLRRSLEGAP